MKMLSVALTIRTSPFRNTKCVEYRKVLASGRSSNEKEEIGRFKVNTNLDYAGWANANPSGLRTHT